MLLGMVNTPEDTRRRKRAPFEVHVPLRRQKSRGPGPEFMTSDVLTGLPLTGSYVFIVLPGDETRPPLLVIRPETDHPKGDDDSQES